MLLAQTTDVGKRAFNSRCSPCHGADGNGGEMGPPILSRLRARNDQQLISLIHSGLPSRGMPPSKIADPELTQLVAYLRQLQRHEKPVVQRTVEMAAGGVLTGQALGEGFDDLQLRTPDGRIHLLRRSSDRYREVTSEVGWPTYNGGTGGNRFTALTQIDKGNIGQLAPRWVFTVPNAGRLQVTPVVVDGLMYVTAPNQCYALDAGTGREIWHVSLPRQADMTTRAGANRGVGIAGDRVFLETEQAHLVALNRWTGELLWDAEVADWHQNYFATSAPLPAGDVVIAGVGGGEHGANGLVAAFDQASGKEVWRFNTVPKPGEPGYESWQGREPTHVGAPTWFTGSYDPELDTVYWAAGNPSEEYNGDLRQGDNLYSDCLLALDRRTGKLKWYFQFTPHDLWDWDAAETFIVANAQWQGRE
ncbi:MAG: PQQ-binding-like beta-propeller repeat protein, partial [Acidobacteriaceae bacterium]|nr:PQQ-binding-like beta-propeller repeat protein [Acidobacteriaceae bacterium]